MPFDIVNPLLIYTVGPAIRTHLGTLRSGRRMVVDGTLRSKGTCWSSILYMLLIIYIYVLIIIYVYIYVYTYWHDITFNHDQTWHRLNRKNALCPAAQRFWAHVKVRYTRTTTTTCILDAPGSYRQDSVVVTSNNSNNSTSSSSSSSRRRRRLPERYTFCDVVRSWHRGHVISGSGCLKRSSKFSNGCFLNATLNGLISGEIYRKP